jgi:hypothetical protein
MIGFNRTPQTALMILTIVFGILLIILQSVRFSKEKSTATHLDRNLYICELLTVLSLMAVVAVNFFLYWNYIPADSPGCLPYISEFGVIASAVDPIKFLANPAGSYPATTYAAAVTAFKSSPNGYATGYFAWDGVTVRILTSEAFKLKSGAPQGTSWVFQSLNTAVSV